MEQRIPIDIHYNKLLDWLIDRRHCNLKWQQSAVEVREKINTALQDMPENEEIAKLLSGSYINYFHCLKIIELLKKCGEGSTNFFGQYSSQRMKDWIDITNDYKEDNIHLAEAAHLLIRNVNYEIPCFKKQIAKCQQTHRDCSRKEAECISNAAIFKEKYQNDCRQMGVHDENVKQGLLNLVNQLPELFNQICKKTCELGDAVNYYEAFVDFVVPTNDRPKNTNTKDILPMLKFISKHGNATVYQWKTGEVLELSTKEDTSVGNLSNLNADDQSNEIDWGTGEDREEANGEIDFGIEDGGIDFGDDDEGIDFGIEALDEGSEAKIDYGIEAVSAGPESQGNEGIEMHKNDISESEDEAAIDKCSVLENPGTRNLFIDDLFELQSFLSQRLEEMSMEGDILSANQFQSAPVIIQVQTKQNIMNMHSKISLIIEDITSMKMQNLYRLKSSPRYVDRLVESLKSKLKTANNLSKQAKIMAERRQAALELQRGTEPKLELIIEKTKELQKQISDEISKKYNNRMVNIMGEVNAI